MMEETTLYGSTNSSIWASKSSSTSTTVTNDDSWKDTSTSRSDRDLGQKMKMNCSTTCSIDTASNLTAKSTVAVTDSNEEDHQLNQKMKEHFQSQTYRLFLLEHAKSCTETKKGCKYKFCYVMKNMLKHISICQDSSFCGVRGCLRSQILMDHHVHCKNHDKCSICRHVIDQLSDDYLGDVKRKLSFEDEYCEMCNEANRRGVRAMNLYDQEV